MVCRGLMQPGADEWVTLWFNHSLNLPGSRKEQSYQEGDTSGAFQQQAAPAATPHRHGGDDSSAVQRHQRCYLLLHQHLREGQADEPSVAVCHYWWVVIIIIITIIFIIVIKFITWSNLSWQQIYHIIKFITVIKFIVSSNLSWYQIQHRHQVHHRYHIHHRHQIHHHHQVHHAIKCIKTSNASPSTKFIKFIISSNLLCHQVHYHPQLHHVIKVIMTSNSSRHQIHHVTKFIITMITTTSIIMNPCRSTAGLGLPKSRTNCIISGGIWPIYVYYAGQTNWYSVCCRAFLFFALILPA